MSAKEDEPLSPSSISPAPSSASPALDDSSNKPAAPRRMIHVIYDISYETWEFREMLTDRIQKETDFDAKTHFLSESNFESVVSTIPREDIVFNYCDTSVDHVPILALKLAAAFPRLIGAGPEFLRLTERKSVMTDLMAAAGLPVLKTICVKDVTSARSAATRAQLAELGLPLFVKVEAGYDSLGLSEKSICETLDATVERCVEMIAEHGPVVVQRFLDGREFTVPCAFGRAYRPVEKILVSARFYHSWDKNDQWRVLDEVEPDGIVQPLMEISGKAYNVCGGDSYGRVDIRQDSRTKELFLLEVNSVCSICENSFFDLGIIPCGLDFRGLFAGMVRDADAKAAAVAPQ